MYKASKNKTAIIREAVCPFCGILCDDLVVENIDQKLNILKNGCHKAKTFFQKKIPESTVKIKNKTASLDDAIDAICDILKKAYIPLVAGLGSDAGGIRQIMHLADKTGSIVDHMHSDDLFKNTLVLQDLGWIMTTLSEIKNRADFIIFAGTDASQFPRFYERILWDKHNLYNMKPHERQIVYIGENLNTNLGVSPTGKKPIVLNCKNEQIGELISSLHALTSGSLLDVNSVAGIPIETLDALTKKMKTASYGVIIWSPSDLNMPYAELTIQNFCETIKYMTRITRFAGFSLGGNDGSTTANNVCTWQSGYPLRVSFNKGYPEYDAHHYSTQNLLKNKLIDALFWVSSFDSSIVPKNVSIPTIILSTPDTKLNFEPDVFIPVATPGLDHSGQLFRTDSAVILPLKKLRQSPYKSVEYIVKQIIRRI